MCSGAPLWPYNGQVARDNQTTFRFSYTQDADTLYRFATDPAAVKARSEAFGERDVQVTRTGDTITNLRLIEVELPMFARGLFTPTNTVLDVKVWDPATKTARFSVDVKNVPTRVSGTVTIVPTAGGCDYVVDVQVACRIPLIGGKIESFVTTATKKALEDEYAYNQKQLGA
jgi:Protein of unknown function (DUF2505)